ncbi:MAG: hypothetical protein KF914_04390 [Rhizobiaceae bacterium]|nr:hypothetical protein [Rhizobiaceae bacterium]
MIAGIAGVSNMFTTPIGRGRFLAYCALVLVAEVAAIFLCIAATTGLGGLAESAPGPSRQGLALAILLMSFVFVAVRGNLAWRRSADAGGLRWVLGSYIVFSAIFAVLQAATFLVYKFGGDNSNLGLNLLGLAITGLWFRILLAPPVGNGWDADAFSQEVEASLRAKKDAPSSPPRRPAPAPPRPQTSAGRPAGFGKRGLV